MIQPTTREGAPIKRTVLLTGATGYIGRRLEKVLREHDTLALRLLVRNAKKLTPKTRQHAQVVKGDTFSPSALQRALAGVHTAIYLIHSMGADQDFSRLDRTSAEHFLNACIEAGVQKIIYLGGLGLRESASTHLASRMGTGEILSSRPERIQTLWLRAGVIVGSGSASFEIIRHLTEKLPFMICPRWVKTLTQPIGIDDVIAYLTAALDCDPPGNLVIDIGTSPMSFLEMLRQTAHVMGLRRVIVPVPLLSPRFSAYWLALFTPVSPKVASALVEGLKSETQLQNDHARRFFPDMHPEPFAVAVRKAIDEMENDLVVSRWCDSSPGAVCNIAIHAGENESIFRDVRSISFRGIAPEQIFASIIRLGGDNGWFSYTFLWKLRGWLDIAAGGYGLNRGRRHASDLRIGDALDFWKVADLVPNKRLLLLAQMKLPGKPWLEFDLQGDLLVQTRPLHSPRRPWVPVLVCGLAVAFPRLSRSLQTECGAGTAAPSASGSDRRLINVLIGCCHPADRALPLSRLARKWSWSWYAAASIERGSAEQQPLFLKNQHGGCEQLSRNLRNCAP